MLTKTGHPSRVGAAAWYTALRREATEVWKPDRSTFPNHGVAGSLGGRVPQGFGLK
jgi:hypothetical protein